MNAGQWQPLARVVTQTYGTLWETSSPQQLRAGSTDGHMLRHLYRNTHSHLLGYNHKCLSSSWNKTR